MAPKTVSVIPGDQMIYVDGLGIVCEFEVDEAINAIQWPACDIEYHDKSKPNGSFKDEGYEYVKRFVDIWSAKKRENDDREAAVRLERETRKREAAATLAAQRLLIDSDLIVLRCAEEGIAVPDEYKIYREELRDIVRAAPKDISKVTFPPKPPKPAGLS